MLSKFRQNTTEQKKMRLGLCSRTPNLGQLLISFKKLVLPHRRAAAFIAW